MHSNFDSKTKSSTHAELQMTTEEPCYSCQGIDIEHFLDLNLVIPENGLQIKSLGRASKNFKTDCSLCALITQTIPTYQRKHQLELRAFNGIPGLRTTSTGKRVPKSHQRILTVVRQNERLKYNEHIANEFGAEGLLVSDGVKLVGEMVDYEILSQWLQDCMLNHNCGTTSTQSLQLYVLDCFDQNVVPLKGEKYVALSYVWGDKPVGSELPLTIRDAMQVVRNIGYRYLWIDRYCISQTDTSLKREAILNMNEVYQNADVTIVAAYGDIHAGLPGVSDRRKVIQQVGKLKSTMPYLSTVLNRSVWSTRGWTYQEARLSRRCLFFTQYQVYLSCVERSVSEALPAGEFPVTNYHGSSGLAPSLFALQPKKLVGGLILDRFVYSQRKLTYQEDALDAFKGVLRAQPFVTLWGLPVENFAMSLLWISRPRSTLDKHVVEHDDWHERRSGFPTWSWTSVVGEIYQTFTKFQSAASFTVNLSDMSLTEAISHQRTNILPDNYRSLYITGDVMEVQSVGHEYMLKYWRIPFMRDCFEDRYTKDGDKADALVLIDSQGNLPDGKVRLMLMLLYWIDKDVAERRGILGDYNRKWDAETVARLPRRKMAFELR